MRYGLLADIHANLPALRAAVRELSGHGVDRWLCAGDVVGYGPHPNECVAELAALDPVCVAGNHELIALEAIPGERCSRRAREALDWTRDALTEDTRHYLGALPRLVELPGLVMAHGSLSDPEEYVRRPEQAQAQLDQLARDHPDAHTLVLGHTHSQLHHRHGGRQLVNPGSVGQSRERERAPLARFALLELSEGGAEPRFFASAYDHRSVRAALSVLGRPTDAVHVHPGKLATATRRLRRLLT